MCTFKPIIYHIKIRRLSIFVTNNLFLFHLFQKSEPNLIHLPNLMLLF